MVLKKSKGNHLVLFDGECPLCHLAVRHIISIDVNKKFLFTPLNSEKARFFLAGQYDALYKANTLILIENFKSKSPRTRIRSRAILRIYWIVGRAWKFLGLFSFFPGFIGDIIYRLFAISRYQFKIKSPLKKISDDRLL